MDGGDGGSAKIGAGEGEFAGWRKFTNENFEEAAGPFYWRRDDDGRVRCAFRAEAKHTNAGGRLHGGSLMTLADMALFAVAWEDLEGSRGVTVTLESQFIDAGWPGELIEATGEVTRAGKTLIFARGQVTAGQRLLLTFSGIIKKIRPRPSSSGGA